MDTEVLATDLVTVKAVPLLRQDQVRDTQDQTNMADIRVIRTKVATIRLRLKPLRDNSGTRRRHKMLPTVVPMLEHRLQWRHRHKDHPIQVMVEDMVNNQDTEVKAVDMALQVVATELKVPLMDRQDSLLLIPAPSLGQGQVTANLVPTLVVLEGTIHRHDLLPNRCHPNSILDTLDLLVLMMDPKEVLLVGTKDTLLNRDGTSE